LKISPLLIFDLTKTNFGLNRNRSMHIFGAVLLMLSLFKIARFMFPKMSSHDRFLVPDVFKAESVALLANGRDTASISQPCLLKFASQREHLRVNGSGTSTKGGATPYAAIPDDSAPFREASKERRARRILVGSAQLASRAG
jgi:hypothetical protein